MLAKKQQLKLLQFMITNYFFHCSRPCTRNCMDIKIPFIMLCKILHATLMYFLELGVFENETCFEQVSCQYFMFLENVMLFEVEIIFLVVHFGINYFGFLCVSTCLTKTVVLPHI
jgi:hypothetical protein